MNSIIRAKCVVVGDSTAGKTAMVQSFLSNGSQFPKNYSMTQGVEVHNKIIQVPDTNYAVDFFLFDCSGKKFYLDLVTRVIKQPSLVILVFDVTSESSFDAIPTWLEQVREGTNDDALKGVIYGTKADLTNRRIVSPKAGRDLANKLGLVYFEGSSKDHNGIEMPFFYLVNEWYKTYIEKTQAMKLVN
ncbi:intraflagellar transport protein 27 homolog [Oratosquilla oratoria]|uniref:intraflagellar transport protein 27 homolog n=1 Tax=Oratosquilla oratoria TaxID=337810 RepID=UPI003F77116A